MNAVALRNERDAFEDELVFALSVPVVCQRNV